MSASSAFNWLVYSIEALLALPIGYLCVLSLAALSSAARRRRTTTICPAPHLRFGVLIPAHNETAVIGPLLASLDRLDYPRALFEIHVVADNCADDTATLARAAGDWVQVHERVDPVHPGKGQALAWLLDRLAQLHIRFDAYVIFDADSTVEPSFLKVMNGALLCGARAVQGRYIVSNARASKTTALRSMALSLANYLRPLGRVTLGGSSTLCGNGMCLSSDLLQEHPWTAMSTVEDYDYYLDLVAHGERVRFESGAVVGAVMPTTFRRMTTQEIRWSGPSLSSKFRTAWTLLVLAARNRDFVRAEAALEAVTPPLTVLVVGSLLAAAASFAASLVPAFRISIALLSGLGVYLVAGLYLADQPLWMCLSLLYAPFFILWKTWVLVVVSRTRADAGSWLRTDRTVG